MEVNWSEFKTFVDARTLSIQYVLHANNYYLKALDGFFDLDCVIPINRDVCADTIDFEDNYKVNGNQSLQQSVNIVNEPRIEYTSKYFAKGDAVRYSCPNGATTNIDLLISNKTAESAILQNENYIFKYLRGGEVWGKNIEHGDYCKFQVIDKDGWLVSAGEMDQQTFDYLKSQSGVGGIVLKEYYPKRFIYPNEKNILKAETPGQIPVGVYLRAVYYAEDIEGGLARDIIINYDIENKD